MMSSRDAERLKAIIMVARQFNHPGDPMSIILDRGGLPRAEYVRSQLKELAAFLLETLRENEDV